jgi:predicted O-methyltransferase YrrM
MGYFSDIKNAFSYYVSAKTKYEVHSPFVYDFITHVLDTSKEYYSFEEIEFIRKKLLKVQKEVSYRDFGAGSKSHSGIKRKIKDIARLSGVSPRDGKIIHNCVSHYGFKSILELGTSLGLGTAYLASGNRSAKVITMEGDPASAYIAKRNFDLLGLYNIELIEGEFNQNLDEALSHFDQLDVAYIDGNHQGQATIEYFKKIKLKLSGFSLMIFDDIYWSDDMLKAWNNIINDDTVWCSINIYSKGFVFFNKTRPMAPDRYTLIKSRFKPWQIGIKS